MESGNPPPRPLTLKCPSSSRKVPQTFWNLATPPPFLKNVQTQGEKFLQKFGIEQTPFSEKMSKHERNKKVLKKFGFGHDPPPLWKNSKQKQIFLRMATLSIVYSSYSNSHSYGIAKSLIIALAKAKLFPKLQLQAKLKTKLYLKTGLDTQLQIGGWWVTHSGK